MPKIAKVIKWSNGLVMVFDEEGKQMPQYQGHYKEMVGLILHDTMGQDVQFFHGKWGISEDPVKRMDF